MDFDWALAWSFAGTMWFTQLCMLLIYKFLVGKNAEYLLCMTIRGEQREDVDVKQLVQKFKNEYWRMNVVLFIAAGGYFLFSFLPKEINALYMLYFTVLLIALILWEFKVTSKYTNRMYELKISKGWGNPPKQSDLTVDTVVSRMKKSMPVSEIWLAIPAWICIGSFVWWFSCATEYKVLLILLITNVTAFVLFCYMYHRMAHGRLKVYSEDSEINYALNRIAKKAWTGCVVWEASLLCGYHFVATLLLHSYMKDMSAGIEDMTGFWIGFIGSTVGSMVLIFAVFFSAANRVKQAKKELAAAADFSYAEDEDAYWRNGYYYNPNDTNTFVESRGYGVTTNMATKWGPITKWVLIGTFIMCIGIGVAMLPIDFGSMKMKVEADCLELRGCFYYKESLSFDEVTEVHLLTERPESSRVWGTGTDRFAMGDFHFKGYGNGKAMMDRDAEYFILVKKQNGRWFWFSVMDEEAMLFAYESIKSNMVSEGKE